MPLFKNQNELNRQKWLATILSSIGDGKRLLDAGAGELRNKKYCAHLRYTSQDFCEFHGTTADAGCTGLSTPFWDISSIDIRCDICDIPEPDASFDVILCSEVLEHIPEPTHAIDEFARLLKPGGILVLTAPFSSNVHMAPFHFCTGFTKYWYEHHLKLRGFHIETLAANGDWFLLLRQELIRLGGLLRQHRSILWPVAYLYSLLGVAFLAVCPCHTDSGLACFGYHCVARKVSR